MKKLILISSITALLAFWVVVPSSPVKADPAKYDLQSFINGQNLTLSNNTTLTYPITNNVQFIDPSGNINEISGSTNGAGVNWPNPVVDVNIYPDANAQPLTNCRVFVRLNFTNALPFANQNFTNGVATNGITPNTSSSNLVTLTFGFSGDGTNYDGVGVGGTTNLFVWAVGLSTTMTNGYVMSTNLPSGFTTGARKMRLLSIVANNTGSSAGILVNGCWLGMWHP